MIERPDFTDAPSRAKALNNALATAVETDQVEMLKLLCDAGALLDEPLISPSPGGKNGNQSIVARAAAHGSVKVLRHLVSEGLAVDEYLDWQERLASREASGLSIDEFCTDEDISRSTYYRWLQNLKGGIPDAVREEAAGLRGGPDQA